MKTVKKRLTSNLKTRSKKRCITHTEKETLEHLIRKLEDAMIEVKTDGLWTKRIIVGAAGLGFLEKFISWLG